MTFAQPFTDYEILDRIGAGAMGTVFKARDRRLGRLVALKVLRPSLARDARYVDRLRREARILASLNHPHIVTGHDLGDEGGYHFFVMELVDGKSLRQLLAERGLFAEDFVLQVAHQAASALDHAHRNAVIHRDIKPGNLLLDADGQLKLTDLGLAKGPTDLALTRDGATVGTPQYIAPEQARNPQDADIRSDLYSLGATLYHLATGVPPFQAETLAELIVQVLHTTPVAPELRNPDLSPGLSLVLRKLLAKDPGQRYQTPGELLADLDRLDQRLPPAVDPAALAVGPAVLASAPVPPSRLPRWARVGATVLALLAAALAGAQWPRSVATAPTTAAAGGSLASRLAAAATPGERLLLLRSASPAERAAVADLAARERELVQSVRDAVGAAIASVMQEGWADWCAALREVATWPDRNALEARRLWPLLQQRSGLPPGELLAVQPLPRLEALRAASERELAERDAALLRDYEHFLAVELSLLAEASLLAGDFQGAEQLWLTSLDRFCDGLRQPRRELLAETTLQRAQERRDRELRRARTVIDAAEQRVAEQLLAEVQELLQGLGEAVAGGAAAAALRTALPRWRHELASVYPPAAHFRGSRGRNPWPQVDARLAAANMQLQAAAAQHAAALQQQQVEEVWRLAASGLPAAAQRLLDALANEQPEDPRWAQHRRCLAALAAAQEAVLTAIASSNQPLRAVSRTAGDVVVALGVEQAAGRLQLWQQLADGEREPAPLTAFPLAPLLLQLRDAGIEPWRGLAAAQAALGELLLGLASEAPARLYQHLATADAFVLAEVWPLLSRWRLQQPSSAGNAEAAVANLRQQLQRARDGGPLRDLAAALQLATLRVPVAAAGSSDQQLLAEANSFLAAARRRAELLAELQQVAPAAAQVSVLAQGDGLRASLALPGPALLRGAGKGWLLVGERLEFRGGPRAWAEIGQQQLTASSGLPAAWPQARCEFEFVLPKASSGQRCWVFEFRGAALVLLLGADDAVHIALLDGDARREEVLQRACQRALAASMQAARHYAVPGAIHRLSMAVDAPLGQRRQRIRVYWEGELLLEETRAAEPLRPLVAAVLPLQQIFVQQLRLQAENNPL